MKANALYTGFEAIGFNKELDECLFLCESKNNIEDLHIKFHLDTAEAFEATGVFFKKELNHYYNPQIYIYDYTGKLYDENALTFLQKRVWSSGNVPLICIFYDTEIKIIDCTTHTKEDKPVFLSTISLLNRANNAYNELFAVKIKTGVFWEEEENRNKFNFKNNSSYNILISWIKELRKEYFKILKDDEISIINKVIIQSILIKYLEERKDENGQNLFQDKYFKEYNNANSFVEVLTNNSNFIKLLEKLQKDFNGNVFEWTDTEKNILNKIDLSLLAKALNGYVDPNNRDQLVLELIRYYEFSYVPVELISRLYEEFLGEDKRNKGLYYTPSHLARLLIDESMPLKSFNQIDLSQYRVLDPACGSGIFLVFAFKRLVQWWRLQQNDFSKKPTLGDLKNLLSCIYGVDKEKQATTLAAFSLCLALCDELSPLQIITQLQFDDLTETNILRTDFFIDELTSIQYKDTDSDIEEQKKNYEKLKKIKFEIIIGNPPFRRSGDLEGIGDKFWIVKIGDKTINIPSKQIALKFLVKSLDFLQTSGLQCLIIKSAALLYNPTAIEFKKLLLSHCDVERIFDFTALARNGVLWDNGAEVDTIALFTRNQSPNNLRNILHLTFRRTKAVKERLSFDIDEYDRHFVNRNDAINNPFIWKTNLIGGGRIKSIVEKLNKLSTLKSTFSNSAFFTEGENGAKSLDNKSFCKTLIDDQFFPEGYINSFKNLEQEKFCPPNILIKENITLPFALNRKNIPYSNEVVGIYSIEKGNDKLLDIWNYLNTNLNNLHFYVIATSSKALVYKNTAIKKEDIENMPYYQGNMEELLSKPDLNIIKDVLIYYQYFLRNGEGSKSVKSIPKQEICSFITNYGSEFSQTLNAIYAQENQKFRLNQIISLYDNSFIGVVFKYDEHVNLPVFNDNLNVDNIPDIAINQISSSLSATRIIKIYEENTIIFIKPNQYRYWLSHIAYRDADKCMVDLSKAGY